jgi:hypothetical protein
LCVAQGKVGFDERPRGFPDAADELVDELDSEQDQRQGETASASTSSMPAHGRMLHASAQKVKPGPRGGLSARVDFAPR